MPEHWEHVNVDNSAMRVYMSLPTGTGPFPAVVVIQHRDGVDKFIQEMANRVAAAGFVAIAPDLYHRDGPGCRDPGAKRITRLRDASMIRDVDAALEFLKAHKMVNREALGIVGFCMGGRVAYLMAAANPGLRAAVDYYGGHLFNAWGGGPSPFDRTKEIHCPILGHFGDQDGNPSPDDMRRLDAELSKYGKVHEFHSYSNAGHAFMNREAASYRPHADQTSWPRSVDFLRRYLTRGPRKTDETEL